MCKVCFVSFSLSLSTYILESLVLLKVLWCFFGTVTCFWVMIFSSLQSVRKGVVYVFFERVSSNRGNLHKS